MPHTIFTKNHAKKLDVCNTQITVDLENHVDWISPESPAGQVHWKNTVSMTAIKMSRVYPAGILGEFRPLPALW